MCEEPLIKDYQRVLVVYFTNDIRVSNGVQQLKQTLQKQTFLKWHKCVFLPCTYTVATETATEYDLYLANIKKIITRFIVYEANLIRISIEYENHQFYLSGETEDVTQAEDFYEKFYSYMVLFKTLDIHHYYDKILVSSYNNITSRKFENFNIGDEINCLAIKYKYDGFKCKLAVISDYAYYFAPVVGIIQRIDTPLPLRPFKRLIFQLECMDDKLIITDVIGVYINKILYPPTPIDTLSFLKSLQINQQDLKIKLNNGKSYQLYAQHEMSEREPIDIYDGYIFVTDQKEYKVKLPTVDLHLIKRFFYLYEGGKKIQVSDFQYDYADGIYEVIRHPQDFDSIYRLIVLRQRFDRHYPCNKAEYENFRESNRKWTEHLKKYPITLF